MEKNPNGLERYWQNWDQGKAAERIDQYWIETEAGWRAILAKDIKVWFGDHVSLLEVGCGTGLVYQELRRHRVVTSDSYVGGDVSKSMLSIARQRYPGVSFVDLDIFDLGYPDRSQPNVICIQVLQHLPYYDKAISELIRVTRQKLYVVSWFELDTEDKLELSPPSSRWDGTGFQNNVYSLPKFLGYILTQSGRPIEALHIHHLLDKNYSISVAFADPLSGDSRQGKVGRLWVRLKRLLGRVLAG
jgi:SAM-dependent methyltransferase